MLGLLLILLPWKVMATVLDEAGAALKAGDYVQGIHLYRELLAEKPASYEAGLGLARALAFADSQATAMAAYDSLLARFPEDVDAHLGRGRVRAWAGRHPEAEADLLWAVHAAPAYGDAWSALGDLYLWTARTEKAAESYSCWAELEPDSPAPLVARAKAWRAARRFPLARQDLQGARERGGEGEALDQLLRSLDRVAASTPWESGLNWGRQEGRMVERMQVGRTFAGGSLAAEGQRVSQGGREDGSLGLDGYLDLWRRGYGNLRAGISGEGGQLPRLDVAMELFQGLGTGWEFSASCRRLEFAEKGATILAMALSRSAGPWYLRGRSSVAPAEGKIGLAQDVALRRYLGKVDDFLELGGGGGRSVQSSAGRAELRRIVFCSSRAQWFLGRLGLGVALSWDRIASGPGRWGANLGGLWRW